MLTEPWIRTGFVAGILTVADYPLLIAVRMPSTVTLILAGGPFSVASIGDSSV
jgi:hypothetical protein